MGGLLKRRSAWLVCALLVVLAAAFAGSRALIARAQESSSLRKTTITVDTIGYDWWLVSYRNNFAVCTTTVEHEGKPTPQEIFEQCGQRIYDQWIESTPCTSLNDVSAISSCPGFYLVAMGSRNETKTIEVDLPLPSVQVSLTGCEGTGASAPCSGSPMLKFTAREPLPNEQIISIQGDVGGRTFSCPGSECTVTLTPTGDQGVTANFWADSSLGDSTESYTAQVRMVPWGDFNNPDEANTDSAAFYVDVISSQWQGDRNIGTCAQIWNVFPDVKGPPRWLQSPSDPSQLASEGMLYYLSAMLIHNGQVDVSACPDGGLVSWNTASECGANAAKSAVDNWQNQFDSEIINVSKSSGVPSQLMKNVFTRESQLWPGMYSEMEEAGLGQLTENGAETVLLWNPDFYNQFCPLVLSFETCSLGFGNLSDQNQALLRGGLMQHVNATCATCPLGIDLSQANFSINIFAQTIIGNCQQVDRMLYNTAHEPTVGLTSYEDLWRFTLVNYNAGPGCLSDALQRAYRNGEALNWQNVGANLDLFCRDSVKYLMDISGSDSSFIPIYNTPLPTSTPTRTPSATQTPTITPTPSITPTVTSSP
jgi:hypothetical protein